MTREPKVGDLETLGDVHAGGESCAHAGEGVTLEKTPPPQHVHMTHHRREHRPVSQGHPLSVPVSKTSASAVYIKFNFTIINLQMY